MKSKGLFQRLVLGTVLGLGFLTVWLLIGIVALDNGRMIAMKSLVEDSLYIRADGTALIVHHEAGVSSYCDLNGAPVAISEDDAIGRLNGVQLLPSLPWQKDDHDWDQRARFFTDSRSPATAWYFIADGQPDGTAYFVGYDSRRKVKIGYLGRGGFCADEPPIQERLPFAGATSGLRKRVYCPGQDGLRGRVRSNRGVLSIDMPDAATPWLVYVLGRDRNIYEANLRNRSVRVIVRGGDVCSFAIYGTSNDPANISWRLVVRTDKAVLVLDNRGKEQQSYPIPEELRDKPFTFGETTAGEAMMIWNSEHDIMETEDASHLFWVQSDGRNRSASVVLPGRPVVGFRYIVAALVPSPLMLDALGVLRMRELCDDRLSPTLSSAFVRTVAEFWPTLAIALVLAAGLAALCYRRQVRYGTSRTERIVWPLFVLLLGLPGWIGYRFGLSWPVLESCPDCGAAVPRDRESCLRCTNDFPRPALKGTEVFA